MKLWKKVVLGVVGLLLAAIAGLLLFMKLYKPDQRPVTDLVVDKSAEAVSRGEYLTTIYGCWGCHSERDWSQFAGPEIKERGRGGFCFEDAPGTICAANLTSDEATGLGGWSDDEILRAMREGVDRDGKALFPIMPYMVFKEMSDEDAHAIVAYLRTLPAASHQIPKTDVDFPVSFFMKLAPEAVTKPVAPPPADQRAAYLTKMALCGVCHTPVDDKHEPLEGQDYSGGLTFETPFGKVTSANITPDATGLGDKTEEEFIGLFRSHAGAPTEAGTQNTIMMWRNYAQMTDEDLKAIYGFLRTVKPIKHSVEKWPGTGK